MPRPQTDSEAERDRLVELAIAMIEERGNAGITLSEIAARAGMAPASLHRYFANRDAVIEAVAEYWFRPKVAIMEEVIASDLPPRRKMYEFFARRFETMKAQWEQDPLAFATYAELGRENFEQVRSYVDLGDHYLSLIIGEAMAEGYFEGLSIDETLSLVNQMFGVYVNIGAMELIMPKLSCAKLAIIVDTVFDGLTARDRGARGISGLRAVLTA